MAQTLPSIQDCCSQPCPCRDDLTGGAGMYVVADLVGLRGVPSLSSNKLAWVGSGLTMVGVYVWNNSDTSADNGTTIIMGNDAPTQGRWNRQTTT